MRKTTVASILHGAYGDAYEQALCLKHYAATHPQVQLRLFAAATARLEAFRALDLSFAQSFSMWTEIEKYPEIESFFQFQVTDGELQEDVIRRLPENTRARIGDEKRLPWDYMRAHKLIPESGRFTLPLSAWGQYRMNEILTSAGAPSDLWTRPTISFLWRYRKGAGAISPLGQKSQEEMRAEYSGIFERLIEQYGCHVLVFGMNLVTDESNRERTDNKYPPFGLDLPASAVTYFKGMSWPIELEIASRGTVCCGHASGFTEGLWLKRGGDMVLMDPPPHYLAKAAYHRMPFFGLNQPQSLIGTMLSRSGNRYEERIAKMLDGFRAPSRVVAAAAA